MSANVLMDRYCGLCAGEPCAVFLPGIGLQCAADARTSEVPLYTDLENHVMHLMQGMHSWTDTVGSGQVNHVQCTYLEQWAADAVPQICPFVGIWNTM